MMTPALALRASAVPGQVKLKVAGCFRSTARADDFCRIRGYISTWRKQSYSVFEGLVSIFAGRPYMPRLGT